MLRRMCSVELSNCLYKKKKKSSAPEFPVLAPMINWVMVHEANTPSHPLRDGPDRSDRCAITG